MSVRISVKETSRKCVNLAAFSNGTVKSQHAGELNVDFFARQNCTNLRMKEHRIMVAETEQMSYVGKNFGEMAANKAKGLCKYYVGVLDPSTNKMKVYDTEKFLLQPHIPGRDELDTGQDQAISIREKKDMLTSAFGSSKKRKAMETRLRHEVEKYVLEGALNSAVDTGLVQAETHKAREDESKDEEFSTVPPCNKEAKTVEDAYSLSDIISSHDMDLLTTCVKPFIDSDVLTIQEWRKAEQYPTYILNHLGTMPLNDTAREHRAKCLLYLHYMITLFNMNSRKIRARDPLPRNWPIPIKKKLLDTFTLMVQAGNRRSNRCCPSRLKDKLATYILTLCLIIDEYSIDLTDLLKDIKVGKSKMLIYASSLGCKMRHKKEADGNITTTVVLKVPLKFPETKKRLKR